MPRGDVSVLRPRPHVRAAIAGCRGTANTSEIAITNVEGDAPSVIVEEYHLHGGGPPSPTIAVWDDGQVLFAGSRGGKRQRLVTRMSKDDAAVIVRDVYQMLERVPRSSTVFDMSGGTLLRITAREGRSWRTAALYGDEPERVLAVARGTAAPPKPTKTLSSAMDFDLVDALAQRPWPPMAFAKAYQRLIEAVPHTGNPFAPHDYDVLFITPEPGIEPQRPALEWPVDLPRPRKLNPAACHYNDSADLDPDSGCRFMLTPPDNQAVERFGKLVGNGGRSRAVNVGGVEFAVRFDETYRGERTIDALTTCADVLGKRGLTPSSQRSRRNRSPAFAITPSP